MSATPSATMKSLSRAMSPLKSSLLTM
jgi:hypothetical protein